MKSVWKGSISFGLVSIPVQLFTAHETEALGFHVLHDQCLTRLEYKRWCPRCKKDVTWDDTVKGIKKTDGSYLVLTSQDIKQLHPEKTEEIKVIEFVDTDQIPVIYLNHHYYVASAKATNSAYALFIKALEKSGKVAIGRFVMRSKEYTCAIQPHNNYLVLTTLFYPYEVRGLETVIAQQEKKAPIRTVELKLAIEMIEKLSVKKLDMHQFKDTFALEIKKMLKQKGKRSKTNIKKSERKPAYKPSLVESLRGSIDSIKSHRTAYASKRG